MADKKMNLESTRQHIQKGGRILSMVCKALSIGLFVAIVVQIVAMVAVFVDDSVVEYIRELYDDNAVFRFLSETVDLSGIPPKYLAMIGCFIVILTQGTLLMLVCIFSKFMGYLAAGGQPFQMKAVKTLRRYAFIMLLMCFYNPLLGVSVFSIMLLFSYIMEYGNYLQERADETNRIQEEMIVSFAEITENKSGQTGQHIKRVSEYAKILADQMGLPAEQSEAIRIASTMHDIGKLLIPSEILEKPGRLTDEEYATIKLHTTYGGQLLENVEGDEMILSRTIAMQHHERYDGHGYPAQLEGENISLEGRIVAVADVYDALTSRRSYKEAWTEEKAAQEIIRGSGTQFDPKVVQAFEDAHDQVAAVREKFAD